MTQLINRHGSDIVKRYTGTGKNDDNFKTSRLNLFYSNTKTLMSMLYGNLPKVDVSRRYADSADEAASANSHTHRRL